MRNMSLRHFLELSSIRDLLAAITSFSLLSLYLTYHLGFLQSSMQRSPSLSLPRSLQLHHLLIELEMRHTRVKTAGRILASLRGGVGGRRGVLLQALASVGVDILPVDNTRADDRWTLLFCTVSSESTECVDRRYDLLPYQRMNHIPGLQKILLNRSGLCSLATRLSRLPALRDVSLTPLCFVLPEQYETYLNTADGLGLNNTWIIKQSKGNLEILTTLQFFNKIRCKQFPETEDGLIEQYIPRQLTVLGFPVSLQMFLLVTSMAPLRVYVYNEGIVNFRHSEPQSYKKIPKKLWLLSQLWAHLSTNADRAMSVQDAIHSIDTLLIQLLLGVESVLHSNTSVSHLQAQCNQCFHLLTFDLMLTQSLSPVILAVSDTMLEPVPQSLSAGLIGDMLKIITARTVVHEEVQKALITVTENYVTGIAGENCLQGVCLNEDDLLALLASRRESVGALAGQYRRIYPSTRGEQYTAYMYQLQSHIAGRNTDNILMSWSDVQRTAKLHEILSRLEMIYSRDESRDLKLINSLQLFSRLTSSNEETTKNDGQKNCSKDDSLSGYLKDLTLLSNIRLWPTFTPLWTEYSGDVSYETTMVRVNVVPIHCQILTRFEHEENAARSMNITLGLGGNRIVVLLQSTVSGKLVNTYVLTLRRLDIETKHTSNENADAGQALCTHYQDCSYRILPDVPCGLQEEHTGPSIHSLPPCSSGNARGRWLVPCASCHAPTTCHWSRAQWQPFQCSHYTVPRPQLNACLRGKKLLFLGDSTNRGMMHYLMEQLNGSLTGCDKTHHIRVYSALNRGHTSISFAYYPQFWLPPNERPGFEKTLHQLLLKSQPLQNTSDTIIIVGGVHWLATKHLHTLTRMLASEGLEGVKVVVKTLGSGFHIAAEGVHYLAMPQQVKLLRHSMGLAALASRHHFEVLDTFNITIARHRDFLQGKCACHFHKLVPTDSGYHVEGPINALYTEILLSRLCPTIPATIPATIHSESSWKSRILKIRSPAN